MIIAKKWYAVYTKPRWEKKVASLLTENDIVNYCPLNRVVRQWSDRKKVILQPLFQSYVFIQIDEHEKPAVRQIDGIINFVYWLGRPAVIKDVEIEIIRKFLNEYENVQLERRSDIHVDDTVRILSGPFMEQEGNVVLVKNHSVKVAIPSLGFVLSAEVEMSNVEVIKTPKDNNKYSRV